MNFRNANEPMKTCRLRDMKFMTQELFNQELYRSTVLNESIMHKVQMQASMS